MLDDCVSFCMIVEQFWWVFALPISKLFKHPKGLYYLSNESFPVKSRHFNGFPNKKNSDWRIQYCWWLKSQTTTWDVWNLINNGINYQPQLVKPPDFSHQKYDCWFGPPRGWVLPKSTQPNTKLQDQIKLQWILEEVKDGQWLEKSTWLRGMNKDELGSIYIPQGLYIYIFFFLMYQYNQYNQYIYIHIFKLHVY